MQASRLTAPVDDYTRVAWFRFLMLGACLAGILLTVPLWMTDRRFPLLPVGSWLPAIPAPWDKWCLAAWLALLILSIPFPRAGVVSFLSGALFLCLADQNRLQPWFYLYSVMLFFTLFPKPVTLAGARIALSSVYFWTGVMKLTPEFFHEVAPWFVEPFSPWLTGPLFKVLRAGVWLVPFIEILVGIGLWMPRCRKLAFYAVLTVHAGALACLGPFGRNYNVAVWPWNVVMPALVWLLFEGSSGSFRVDWRSLSRCPAAAVVAMLFCVMPAFHWAGWWDSYLSFSLYSGHGPVAAIHVSAEVRDRLPEELRRFARPLKTPSCLPTLEGTYRVDHLSWALSVLGAPSLPEERGFHSMAGYLLQYRPARQEGVAMLLKTSGTPVRYFEGERFRGFVLPEATITDRAGPDHLEPAGLPAKSLTKLNAPSNTSHP